MTLVLPDTNEITDRLENLPASQFEELEHQLRPGQAARSGFLGHDEHLMDVISADVKALADVDLTPQEVGLNLWKMLNSSQGPHSRWKDSEIDVPSHIFVRAGAAFRGSQHCPFEAQSCGATCGKQSYGIPTHKSFANMDFKIENSKTGQKIKGPGLIVHLAVNHNFFEGTIPFKTKAFYRVDPIELARAMDMI